MRGGDGLERVGSRRRERDDHRDRSQDHKTTPPEQGRDHDQECGRQAEYQEGRSQLRVPGWAAVEQHFCPHHGGEDGERHHPARHQVRPALPQHPTAGACERANRRRQGDRVVGVDDPLGQAEHCAGDEKPAAEQDDRGSADVSPRRRDGVHDRRGEQDQRRWDQPRHLPTEIGVEQPVPASRAPSRDSARRGGDDTAVLVAGDTTEAVVAEDQLEDAVGLRAADVRA